MRIRVMIIKNYNLEFIIGKYFLNTYDENGNFIDCHHCYATKFFAVLGAKRLAKKLMAQADAKSGRQIIFQTCVETKEPSC